MLWADKTAIRHIVVVVVLLRLVYESDIMGLGKYHEK